MESRATIKTWFVRHAKPLEVQFAAWLDSYRHLEDKIYITDVEDLPDILYDTPTKQDLYDLDDKKYDKTGGDITGKVTIRKSRSGNFFEVVDVVDGEVLLRINEYGQIDSFGTPNRLPFASGGFNVWRNGNLRLQMVTEDGDFKLNMYNNSNQLVCKLDTNGLTKLLGVNVQNNKIENLADPVNDTDAINLGKVKALIAQLVDSAPETLDTLNELAAALGDDPNFATTVSTALGQKMSKSSNLSDSENRQTAVNNLFDVNNLALGQTLIKDEYGNMVPGNAGGGASQDSIEFPVPTVYTYTGDYITKVVETITDGTIEKRFRYYISASPIVDGSPDIMEYKNSVTNFWARATYNYTAGKLTSITTETIIAWTI